MEQPIIKTKVNKDGTKSLYYDWDKTQNDLLLQVLNQEVYLSNMSPSELAIFNNLPSVAKQWKVKS